MLRLLGEAHDLVFDRRAVARTDGLDLAGVHRRAMHVVADELQRLRRRVRDVAADLTQRRLTRACVNGERKLNGVGSASPGCSSKRDQSMVRPSSRGGVPVFRRHSRRPRRFRRFAEQDAGGSPQRPAVYCCSPQWMRPFRKVPVVTTVAAARTSRPSRSLTPAMRRIPPCSASSTIRSTTSACLMKRFGLALRAPRASSRDRAPCRTARAVTTLQGHAKCSAGGTGCRRRRQPRP